MPKQRLDTLLASRGLFASRTQAAASIMAGEVQVGAERRVAEKPGEMVEENAPVAVRERPRFVSRGGIKLANALAASELAVEGRHAIDVGASTGGFTDCLLQAGVSEVIALDVAYGQLDYSLRTDPRVHVIERANARAIEAEDLPYRPDLAVVDVSFISLAKVLPALLGALTPRYDVLALVKPQFELGQGRVGKGGVVRDSGDRRDALLAIGRAGLALGAAVLGFFSSELPGPKGNRESFIWLAETGRPGSAGCEQDLEAMARKVEP